VVVDYLQLIDNSRAGDQRYVQVGGISHALKWIASELGIALLALCQLNRASTQRVGGEPRLSDIRESDDISHDADLVLLLHRPSLCGEKSKRDVLLVPKNRIPGGQFKDRIELRYDPETNSYSEA
jgi:replicative DNA helicase